METETHTRGRPMATIDRWVCAITDATGLRFRYNGSGDSAYAIYDHESGRAAVKVRVSDHAPPKAGVGFNRGTGECFNVADLDFRIAGRIPSRTEIRHRLAKAIYRNKTLR
jgi:hypothetical protein